MFDLFRNKLNFLQEKFDGIQKIIDVRTGKKPSNNLKAYINSAGVVILSETGLSEPNTWRRASWLDEPRRK